MTTFRPAATGIVARALDSISLKTALVAIISVTAWHFGDSGKIEAHSQQLAEHGQRLEVQADLLTHKVDRDTYQADQRETHEDLREIRLSQDRIIQLITERQH